MPTSSGLKPTCPQYLGPSFCCPKWCGLIFSICLPSSFHLSVKRPARLWNVFPDLLIPYPQPLCLCEKLCVQNWGRCWALHVSLWPPQANGHKVGVVSIYSVCLSSRRGKHLWESPGKAFGTPLAPTAVYLWFRPTFLPGDHCLSPLMGFGANMSQIWGPGWPIRIELEHDLLLLWRKWCLSNLDIMMIKWDNTQCLVNMVL